MGILALVQPLETIQFTPVTPLHYIWTPWQSFTYSCPSHLIYGNPVTPFAELNPAIISQGLNQHWIFGDPLYFFETIFAGGLGGIVLVSPTQVMTMGNTRACGGLPRGSLGDLGCTSTTPYSSGAWTEYWSLWRSLWPCSTGSSRPSQRSL
jgi:hypothetical protein